MISVSPEQLEQLTQVNAEVNANTHLTEEPETFRSAAYFAFPENMYPDSRDRALEKIKVLTGLGWPRGELRLTTCWTRHGDNNSYHSVVTIDADAGTLVLDSFFARVMSVDNVPYDWHKRERPGVGWVNVNL